MNKLYVKLEDREVEIDITQVGGATRVAVLEGEASESAGVDLAAVHANPQTGEGLYSLIIDGKSYQMYVAPSQRDFIIEISRHRIPLRVLTERDWRLERIAPKQVVFSGKTAISAPMPGLVKQVLVEVGAEVVVGSRLLVLEAMKMENEIISPRDGHVTEVHVQTGLVVEGGKPLITIE